MCNFALRLGHPVGPLRSAIFTVHGMCDFLLCHNTVSFFCCSACNFSVLCSVTSGCDCVNRGVCVGFSVIVGTLSLHAALPDC